MHFNKLVFFTIKGKRKIKKAQAIKLIDFLYKDKVANLSLELKVLELYQKTAQLSNATTKLQLRGKYSSKISKEIS